MKTRMRKHKNSFFKNLSINDRMSVMDLLEPIVSLSYCFLLDSILKLTTNNFIHMGNVIDIIY